MTDFSQITKAATFTSHNDFTKLQAKYYDFMLEEGYNHVLIYNSDFSTMCYKASVNDCEFEVMDFSDDAPTYLTYTDAFVNCTLYSVAFVKGNVVLQDEVNLTDFFKYLVVKNKYRKPTYDLKFIGITNKYVKHLKNNECQLALTIMCTCEIAGCSSYSAFVIKNNNNIIVPFLVDTHTSAEFCDMFFDLEAITKDALGLSELKYVDWLYYSPIMHTVKKLTPEEIEIVEVK